MPSGEDAKKKLYKAIREQTSDLYERDGLWSEFNKYVKKKNVSEDCKSLSGGLLAHVPKNRMGCAGHSQYNSPKSLFEHEWFKGTGLTYETLKTKQYHNITNWSNLEHQLKELNVREYEGFTDKPEQYQLDSINKIQKEGTVNQEVFKDWDMTVPRQ